MTYDWEEVWKQQAAPHAPPESPPPNGTAPGTEGGRRYALAALESECAELAAMAPDSGRNSRLNTAAFRMGRHVSAGNIDGGMVRQALEQAARACRLPQHEIDTVLRASPDGALMQGQAHPRHPRPLEAVPTPTVLDLDSDPERDLSSLIREKFPLVDFQEIWDSEDEEEWIVEPLLPARRLVALFSAPKVGKSLLMLEIAVGVACGEMVLGVTPDRPRRVLYVDFENDPRGDVVTRLKDMGRQPGQLDNLCYLSYPNLAKLDTFAGAAELTAVIAEYGCEVVVIDTISRAVAGEENENDTWLAFYRHTGLALKQAGISCIRLDHTGKDHDKGMRGGSAKYGDVDAVWRLSKITEETYQLDCTDHRLPIPEPTLVLRRMAAPRLWHEVQADGKGAAWAAKVAQAIAVLDEAEVPNKAGRDEAKDVLAKYGHRFRTEVIGAAVKERKRRVGVLDERLSDADM